MPPAIGVARLSKRYQIGVPDAIAGSFREQLVQWATAPGRRLRRLNGASADDWFWALSDVSFDVQPGEVVGVIGRNGAGKSTLLKILSRITEPTSGRVELRGRLASLLEVGTGFHPDLTGRENIFLNGAILGMRRAEIRRAFDAIVEFAEIATFLDTPVKRYSSGMYLRLAFSVAAHLSGELLLVDEVLAVGDVAFQKKCLGKMHDVSRGGRTVVFISHNMSAVSSLCNRGIVIDRGRIVHDGPAGQAVRFYLERNLADCSTSWDLSAAPRPDDLGSLVHLDRAAAIMDGSDGFRFAESLRFRVELHARGSAADVACAVGLDSLYGTRVVTFSSEPRRLSVVPGETYAFDVSVPPFGLLPGTYLLSVSVFSGGTYHDYAVHFGAVTVVPIDAASGRHVEDQSDRGAITVPSVWQVAACTPERVA